MSEEIKLTDKQRLFCHEYLKDLNGTQAAIRAGYSENSAQEIASENLSKPKVSEYLEKLKNEKFKQVDITVDDILQDIIATRSEAASEKKHSDRLKANELLGKYKKMWTDKVDVQPLGKDGQPVDPVQPLNDFQKEALDRWAAEKYGIDNKGAE